MSWTKHLAGLCAAIALASGMNDAFAATPSADAPFVIANMAPPEPEEPAAPPEATPATAPDVPSEPTPPDTPSSAEPTPEASAEPAAAQVPPAAEDSAAPSSGMGTGVWVAIVAAIATALIAGYWVTTRK